MSGLILVRDIMTKNVKTVRPSSTIIEGVRKMNKFSIGSVVVTQGKRVVGMITERDILMKVVEAQMDPSIIKAKEIMSTSIITVDLNTPIEEASRIMTRNQIKKLPVVDEGSLVGIVTATDITRSAPQLINLLQDIMWKRI